MAAALMMAGEPRRLSWWAFALPTLAWMVSPATAAYFLASKRPSKPRLNAMLIYFVAFALTAALAYYDGLIGPQSSTGSLIIIFLPIFQWGVLLAILLAIRVLEADSKTA